MIHRLAPCDAYPSIPMLISALTFTAIAGIAALCVGCAGRSSVRATAEPPAAVTQAPPPPLAPGAVAAPPASRPAIPQPESSVSTVTKTPAEPHSVGPPVKATTSTSVAVSSPRTMTTAKPGKSASVNPTSPPDPTGHAAVTDGGVQPLNLSALTLRLRNTSALGVFTKLSLKNQVDDLLDDLRAYHRHESTTPLSELRRRYDTLLRNVLALVQSGDPPLATDIASSREAIWSILSDPKKFSTI